MRMMVWKTDEGPTDLEFKAGDIFSVHPDSWGPGNEETLKWLVVQMPDYGGPWDELVASDYTVGPTPEENVLLHMRKYYLPLERLTPGQQDKLLNPATRAPIVSDVFGIDDILRR